MKDYEPFFEKLRLDIQTRGWSIVAVGSNAHKPSFAHTVGLVTSFKHPEIIVFGLDLEDTGIVLNSLGSQIKKGQTFKPGTRYTDVFQQGYDAQFVSVLPQHHSFISFAFEQKAEMEVTALQLLFPDQSNRFPLEEGFDQKWMPPLLNRLDI